MVKKPEPKDSVAQLLEQLIEIATEQLAVSKQILAGINKANSTLTLINMVSQNTNEVVQKSLRVAKQQLRVAEATLESSKRIEELLGGEESPARLRIEYLKTIGAPKT